MEGETTMTESQQGDGRFTTIELPEKTYFKIGEVAKLLEVEPYVLRYWETEFDVLAPEKTKSGQRVYQRDDIELIFQIRALLYEEMFTIAGARRQLDRSRQGKPSYFDLKGQSARVQGTAVAGGQELRQELEQARRQLAATEGELQRVEEQLAEVEGQRKQLAKANDELKAHLQKLEQMAEQSTSVEASEEVERRQEQVVELQERLEDQRRQAADRQRQLENKLRKRDERKRQLLGSLRQEVETLAAVAAPSSSRSS